MVAEIWSSLLNQPTPLSRLCREELGRILEEAGAENLDVALLGPPEGIAKLRKFLNAIRRRRNVQNETRQILGPACHDPKIMENDEKQRERLQRVATKLVMRLMTECLENRISIEDIERLAAVDKRALFIRSIIIELMICLKPKGHERTIDAIQIFGNGNPHALHTGTGRRIGPLTFLWSLLKRLLRRPRKQR